MAGFLYNGSLDMDTVSFPYPKPRTSDDISISTFLESKNPCLWSGPQQLHKCICGMPNSNPLSKITGYVQIILEFWSHIEAWSFEEIFNIYFFDNWGTEDQPKNSA